MSKLRVPKIPWVWAWGAVVLAFPWSNAFMSIATAWLGLVTLTQMQKSAPAGASAIADKALRRTGWALILLVVWSGLSVLWGGEAQACLHDVRVKLPLAVGGWAMIIMARQGRTLDDQSLKLILKGAVFSAGLATVSLIACDLLNGGLTGGRQSSLFISHIRFGLWWALLLPWVGHRLSVGWAWACLIGALSAWTWMEGVTGLLVGLALSPWWLPAFTGTVRGQKSRVKGWPTVVEVRRNTVLLAGILIPIFFLLARALPTAFPQAEQLPKQSRAGEIYVHKLDRRVTENGHFVWTQLAWGELSSAWRGRSGIPLDSIQGVLVRYLSSKGLAKDAEGVAALSKVEIEAVASGVTSVVELRGGAWQRRWNRFKFNWGQWLDGRRSPNASVLARAVYLEVAFDGWRGLPPWAKAIGVGVGHVGQEMERGFLRSYPEWPPEGRKRPHNQYLTLALTLGVVGLGVFLWALTSMWAHRACRPGVLLLVLSCLTEDTLETQAGVTLAVVALAFGAFLKTEQPQQ